MAVVERVNSDSAVSDMDLAEWIDSTKALHERASPYETFLVLDHNKAGVINDKSISIFLQRKQGFCSVFHNLCSENWPLFCVFVLNMCTMIFIAPSMRVPLARISIFIAFAVALITCALTLIEIYLRYRKIAQ